MLLTIKFNSSNSTKSESVMDYQDSIKKALQEISKCNFIEITKYQEDEAVFQFPDSISPECFNGINILLQAKFNFIQSASLSTIPRNSAQHIKISSIVDSSKIKDWKFSLDETLMKLQSQYAFKFESIEESRMGSMFCIIYKFTDVKNDVIFSDVLVELRNLGEVSKEEVVEKQTGYTPQTPQSSCFNFLPPIPARTEDKTILKIVFFNENFLKNFSTEDQEVFFSSIIGFSNIRIQIQDQSSIILKVNSAKSNVKPDVIYDLLSNMGIECYVDLLKDDCDDANKVSLGM